ncbi:DUF2871 domain-containing protein [Microbacterium bovistercoris]|uniref:DUF2871 domain-containing protein n=1 Tax=Microbacterium bovistercoris TaxID=2293570 RepID=A0A371NUG1_9MICO|nr:DUF2871 domain-containing protein [Microbacterium bovistercoris]REJ06001.1 DUF2871 domain-containing protein [Microbacterium bovistercoris]
MTEASVDVRTQRSALTKLFSATALYTGLGLAAGLFYREFTKANGFPEGFPGQLAVTHTHLLVLGMIVPLIVLALEKTFRLSESRLFGWFFWIYNAGVVLTTAMMVWHGSLQVLGVKGSAAISGIAGLGHILIGAGFVLLLVTLGKAIRRG